MPAYEVHKFGGATRIRTGESGICSPLPYHLAMAPYQTYGAQGRNRTNDTRIFSPLLYHLSYLGTLWENGAGNEARTRYLHLGKVALYRMSYARLYGDREGT